MAAKRTLCNDRGQSAILIAMLFNVLFVFFAMGLNVALIVHDKINLQNSTDLAVYYAASRQAEILNVIAHENYMIRQSWKLLAWRYRVLGTVGMIDTATAHPSHTGNLSDTVWTPAQTPSMCITYQPNWREVPAGENLCRKPNVNIPPLPEVKVIAGFLGLNQGIAALSRQLIAQFNDECVKHGAFNWWFAMSILQAFRIDQQNRIQVIEALAHDLAGGSNGDFTDINGQSVLSGAQQTFDKNLTFENQGASLKLVNSMAGLDPSVWLPKILIAPTLLYADIDNSHGCTAVTRPLDTLPQIPAAQQLLLQPWPQGLDAAALVQLDQSGALDSVSTTSDQQFTLGVEKNPWYMVYMGAIAQSAPREIFFPLGNALPMYARAYAKPFGGRVGPWYADHWNSGAQASDGNPTDALVPPRVGTNGSPDPQDPRRLPNFSRFPGDQLGMTSALTQNEIVGLGTFNASYSFYLNIKADFSQGGDNDILAWDGQGPQIRKMEIAAIAPDLYDITYYSIEPNFYFNYFQKLQANAQTLGIPSSTVMRPDLGFNANSIQIYTVQQQISDSQTLEQPAAYYFVRAKAHLLTDWLPGPGAYNYNVSQEIQNFAKCQKTDDDLKYFNPGSCVAGGGRTGYSTKLVSRDLLLSGSQPIGGAQGTAGPILNPPQDDDPATPQ